MLDEHVYWPAASGPFRVGGEGWHWQAERMEIYYRSKLSSRQRRLIEQHFFDLYSLACSMAHAWEEIAGIPWRFDGGRTVRGTHQPFTIYHAQSPAGQILGNVVYNAHGLAVVQVDFVRHGAQRSGHWHPLVPGSFYHLEHYSWDTCPVLWQLVPRKVGPLHTEIGR